MKKESRKALSKNIVYLQLASILLASLIIAFLILFRFRSFTYGGPLEPRFKKPEEVIVIVYGDVRNQGVYFIRKGMRIKDFLNELDPDLRNLTGSTAMIDIRRPAKLLIYRDRGGIHFIKQKLNGKERLLLGLKLDVNEATFDELVSVPGIGPVLAQRIMEFKKENGPFSRIEELTLIKGIKERRLEKLRRFLCVDRRI